MAGGQITIEGGKFVLKDVVFTTGKNTNTEMDTVTIDGDVIIKGTVTIPVGVLVDISGDLEIDSNASVNVGGAIEADGEKTNDGTIYITAEDARIPPVFGGTGSVDTSAVASEGTISGDWKTTTTYTQNQTITLTGDTTLVKGTQIIVMGKLVIPEGITLTIEDEAQLVMFSSTALLVNDGAIVVEGDSGVIGTSQSTIGSDEGSDCDGTLINLNGAIVNNGTIELAYDGEDAATYWTFNNSGALTNNGTITVYEDSRFYMYNNMVNSEGATIDVRGTVHTGGAAGKVGILNAGTVTVDGTVFINLTVNPTSTDAVFQMTEVSADDAHVYVYDSGYESSSVSGNDKDSVVEVYIGEKDAIAGLEIGFVLVKDESITSSTKYIKVLTLAGTVSNSTSEEEEGASPYTVITVGGEITVTGDLVLGEGVNLDVRTTEVMAVMTVPGTISFEKDSDLAGTDGGFNANQGSVITVTGTVSGNDKITGSGTINAVYYMVDNTAPTPDMHYYTTLSAAAEAGAQKLYVLGTVEVEGEVTIGNGITLDNDQYDGLLVIDQESEVKMVSGSKLKNNGGAITVTSGVASGAGILVNGTFYIEDVKGTKNPGTIQSEVKMIGDADVTYTSLTNALMMSESGDTIELSNETTISKDTTIPAGVTVDTKQNAIIVGNDATLTVQGTLFLNASTLTLTSAQKETDTMAAKDAGAIVLEGTIKSTSAIDNGLKIAGAYYSITASGKIAYYVEPVSVAAPKIATVDYLEMTVNAFATDLALGDVAFTGTADAAATVKVVGEVNGNITLDLASVVFDGKDFTGSVSNAVGTVSAEGTSKDGFTVKSTTGTDGVQKLTVTGGFDAATYKKVTVTGDVVLAKFDADSVTVDGNATVSKSTGATVVDKLVVNGTVTVENEAVLTVSTKAEVLGTITATAATDSKGAGKVTVPDLYLGITEKKVTGAGAAISENVAVSKFMYVVDGSAFPADMVEGKKYVALYVEDALWMTVYAFGTGSEVVVKEIPVENVELVDWVDDKGKTVTGWDGKADNTYKVTLNDKEVYAKINYDVYEVTFVKAEGINDIYVDNVLVDLKSTLMVDAGEHKVTYTLANGYTGEAKMLVNGTEVSGYSFTAEGDYETASYAITLQGIEKAPAEVGGGDAPTVIQPSEAEDEGMDLTDILLIILVVLIVIMAVIVALRMMRS
ncbi:MAG: hypothetical protein IJ026_02095 [Candidatus Methanomethylophilaceae archaeon]|nr:hypothetical protein [Candidatus Methanomethylophilaceae archaeon]